MKVIRQNSLDQHLRPHSGGFTRGNKDPHLPTTGRCGAPAPGKVRAIAFFTVLLAILSAAVACGRKGQTVSAASGPQGMPAASVTVATAAEQAIPLEIQAVGNAQPIRTVQLKSMVDGQIAKVLLQQGQDVRAGQLLFQLDQRPFVAAVNQAEGQLAKDEANLWNSRAQANRNNALLQAGVVAVAAAQQQEAQARADAAAAQADKATVQTAKVNLGYTEIRAPIDARAGAVLVNLGNLVKANDTNALATLNQIEPIYVQFNIAESQLAAVRAAGGRLEVRAAAPNDPQPSTGVLTFIDNAVDTTTGTIRLMGTFANRDRRLWPGEFLNVHLVLGVNSHAVVIPAGAVQNGQQGKYVYVVDPDGTAVVRPVQTTRNYRQLAVIDGGLKPGERVITDGQIAVVPNNKVNVVRTVEVSVPEAQAASAPAAAQLQKKPSASQRSTGASQ